MAQPRGASGSDAAAKRAAERGFDESDRALRDAMARGAQELSAITPAPAITRCSCSTSLATSNAVLCVPATCTALTAGTTC